MNYYKNLETFLRTFDPNNKIHQNVITLFYKGSDLLMVNQISQKLIESSINASNLSSLVVVETFPEMEAAVKSNKKLRLFNSKVVTEIKNKIKEEIKIHENIPITAEEPKQTEEIKKNVKRRASEQEGHTEDISPEPEQESTKRQKTMDPSCLFLPLQCKLCGLRFGTEETDSFTVHLEDHRRKTRALSDKILLRREFFFPRNKKREIKLELSLQTEYEDITWSKDPPECSVCGARIEKVWRDSLEEWVLDEATRIGISEFAHRNCIL